MGAVALALSPNGSGHEASHLLPHALFVRALSLERKRAERSGHRFVLMLIDAGGAATNGTGTNLLTTVASVLSSSIRETDIAGWHTADHMLGVIFAELGEADTATVLAGLRTRMTATLKANLRPDHFQGVHVSFYCFPDTWDGHHPGPPAIEKLYPDVAQRDEARKGSRVIKRAMDIAGSAFALIIFSPILLVIALAVKLSSPGSILFRQQRIGQYGRPFTFLKFRSMYTANNSDVHRDYVTRFIAGKVVPAPSGTNGHAVYKITADPRVTRVGKFLRHTSLDELPQFLNVLRGEMSLVGPRPPLQYEVDAYDVWHRRRLLEVKPGITGLWQVNGRSRLPFDDMVRLDLNYAQGWSVWLDIRILLKTPRAVLTREGAY